MSSDTSPSEDRIEFVYGDDYGEISIEELGTHDGTTTCEMGIPRPLAVSLYEQLHEELSEATDKYIVYGLEGLSIANACLVEATTENEAIQTAKDEVYVGSQPKAKKVGDIPEHGDFWAAVR